MFLLKYEFYGVETMEYMKEVIKKLAGSAPEQIRANADAKYNFDNDSKALIEAFAKIGIALRDENGDYRNIHEVLKDTSEKYEKLLGQINEQKQTFMR